MDAPCFLIGVYYCFLSPLMYTIVVLYQGDDYTEMVFV